MVANSEANDLTKIILKALREKKPESVEQLARILLESHGLSEEATLKSVAQLQAEGIIRLENLSLRSGKPANYLKTGCSLWYWLTIALVTLASLLSFTISEDTYPWIFVKDLLSMLLILFFPGFVFLKALFPTSVPAKMTRSNFDGMEMIALSLGLSIAFVSIFGLLLYYSPWGLNLITMVPTLYGFTSVFATIAVIREYYTKKVV